MKSSIMTMSCCASSFGPGATLPAWIRTDAMRASSNLMPKKDRLPLPGEAGTKLLNSNSPSASKYSISVLALRFPCFVPGPLPSKSSHGCQMIRHLHRCMFFYGLYGLHSFSYGLRLSCCSLLFVIVCCCLSLQHLIVHVWRDRLIPPAG